MKVELLIKKNTELSEQAREVLEELREELGLEIEEIDVQKDSFLYLRHRYDLPVIRLDGRILSQRTADRDEIARRLRHARKMKESQGIESRLASGQDGRRVVKVSMADLAAAPRPAPPPYATPPTTPSGERRVVKVSLASVAGQAFPRSEPEEAKAEAPGKLTEKLPALPLPAPGGEIFFVDGFAGGALRRKLEAIPGIEEVRIGPATGVVGLRGSETAIRSAAADHRGSAPPSSPLLALGLAAAASLLCLGAMFLIGGPAFGLGALGALLPLALREGRWLLRDLPLVGAHPLVAGAGFLLAASLGAVPAALAAGPAAIHLVGLAFVLFARRRAREALADFEEEKSLEGRQVVEEGAPFPADGRLLGPCLVDERSLAGDEDAERSAGETIFAGTIALERVEFEASRGPSRSRLGRERVARALAEVGEGQTPRLLLFAPLAALVVAAAGWFLVGPAAGAAILGGVPVLALALYLPLGRATALVRAFADGVAVASWRAIARAGAVRTVVFGKRALLERGVPTVLGARARKIDGWRLLELAAAAEKGVEHPIARAIVAHAEELGRTPPSPARAPTVEDGGVEAEVEGSTVRVGSFAYLASKGVDASSLLGAAQEMGQRGSTPVLVAVGSEAAGILEIGASPSDGARQAVASLELREVGLYLATADHGQRARWLAQALGLDPSQAVGELTSEKENRMLQGLERPILLAAGPAHQARASEADLAVGAEGATEDLPAFLVRPDPRGIASLVRTGRVWRKAGFVGLLSLALGSGLVLGLGLAGLLAPAGALALSLGATALALGAALAPAIALR